MLTNEEIEKLINQGFIKLTKYQCIEDPQELLLNGKFKGTYSTGSEFQERYHNRIGIDKLASQLAEIANSKFQKNVDPNDVYKILRIVKSIDHRESYRMHFDSHLFTLVTPVLIPKSKSLESGQLVIFPNLRKEPIGEIFNVLSKLYYKIFLVGSRRVTNFSRKFPIVEFDFSDNNPVLFLGRATLHGNRGFSDVPEGYRITMLTHFFDPSPRYGIGNLVRLVRNR